MAKNTMAQKLDEDRASFLDLPAEIRNNIYELCLTSPEGIMTESFHSKERGFTYHAKTAAYNKLVISPGLLRTCRTINSEATPILYGLNRFHLNYNSDWLLVKIGENIKHMRQIKIKDTRQAVLIGCLGKLKRCQELVDLEICCRALSPSPERLAKILGPLVRDLHKKRKGTAKEDALEVVRFGDFDKVLYCSQEDKDKIPKLKEIIKATLK